MSVIITIFATSYDEMAGGELPEKRNQQAIGAGRAMGESNPRQAAKAAGESARIYDIHYLLINLDL